MTAALGVERTGSRSSRAGAAGSSPSEQRPDAFPHTKRPLPWVLAGFLAMVFFVPIAATELKVHLPVDSRIDRFAVIGLVLSWLWFGGDQRAFFFTRRSKLFVSAACIYLLVATTSLLVNAQRIIPQGEFQLSEKRLALLLSMLILAWFALTALRFADVRGFVTLLIGFATLTAIGIIVERRTGNNIFYNWSRSLLSPIATVEEAPTVIHPKFGGEGRVTVVGPTNQGLAATTMLVMVMPFALVRIFDSPKGSRIKWLYVACFAVLVAGALATDRKTALVVPVALVLYIAFYRPRQVLKLAPVGAVLLAGVVHLAAPGAIGTVFAFNENLKSRSTTHRTGDFAALKPDVMAHPILGRGFGSIDPDKPALFRINDDEYLDELWQGGIAGLAAFIFLVLSPVILARRGIRSRDPAVSSLTLAASAGCFAFAAACPLFDSMGFSQVPYLFFLLAAMTTIAAAGPAGDAQPLQALAAQPRAGRSRAVAAV